MYVLCARQLAQLGHSAFCFDFSGTGDSYGEWGAFTWVDWQQNLVDVYRHIRAMGIDQISVIALRLGALTVADTVANRQLQFAKCIFWDPVDDGESYVRQLIRLKMAAAMADDATKLSTKDVLADVDTHGFLEVGGYHIAAELLASIKQSKIGQQIETLAEASQLHWLVLKNASQNGPLPHPVSVPENLHGRINMRAVADTRFWMQQEVTIAPALLQTTSELFGHAH